ncbi:lytic murein transglycosylase [Alsobacter soli]|uniref:Lytic murein transglycosylase n=1 Tax=Alsobacter soli TaxID=2109933 RepID=A0A2T1HM65_9HYPH|nr:lytic murein transglycosylase [Alsobacter soli]PSC02743.1 lytic murein transglycosylase [Alsobacter soli]
MPRRPPLARLMLFAVLTALPAGDAALAQEQAPAAAPAGFSNTLSGLAAKARAAGVRQDVVDAALAGLSPDPSLMAKPTKQPEFSRPLQDYVADAASPARAARGRALATQWRPSLEAAAAASGVPGAMLLALWAMETDYGRDQGARDVLRSLATLAFARPETPSFGDEVVAALVMLQHGVARDRLRGSWAGAMGNPQFLPSAYLKHAVSLEGRPNPDIWTSVPDSLASIGNFLKNSGWAPGAPAAVEVVLPAGFEIASLRQDARAWARAGLRSADGSPLPDAGEAMLFLPSGAKGPAFLLYPNFFVLKVYNFSDSYAMAAAVLADRIAGGPGVRAPWPKGEKLLGQSDRARLQRTLAALGLYQGQVDGRFGPVTREAIHAFQRRIGWKPADGYPSAEILARAVAEAGG